MQLSLKVLKKQLRTINIVFFLLTVSQRPLFVDRLYIQGLPTMATCISGLGEPGKVYCKVRLYLYFRYFTFYYL